MATSLNEIGLKYGTDKATTHFYMDNYERYFHEWRLKKFVMWEIGVGNGSSIKTWREYFVNAEVFGIDNNPDCAAEGIFIGDQKDEKFLAEVMQQTGVPSLVVEDGSHYGPTTIATFKWLFPRIKEGGIMAIEDAHCFYDQTYGCAPPFGQGMSEVFNFFSSLASHVDVMGRGYTGDTKYALELKNPNFAPVPEYSPYLDSMHIHPSLWFFQRKK